MSRTLVLLIAALVSLPFLLRLPLLETRGFNPDELMHLHFSWCVSKGLLPYVDYFDFHMPGLHFFMSLFYGLYDVERVADDAIAFILMSRRWMWMFAAATLVAVLALGRAWRDARVGWVAMLLLSYSGFFFTKSLELRPGVPAAALLVAGVLLGVLGVRKAAGGEGGAAIRLFSSGLALGLTTLFTQKSLFVGPGFALATAWFVLDPRLGATRRARLLLSAIQTSGFLAPLLATLAYFGVRGAAWEFIEYNFILTTQYPGWGVREYLIELVRQDAAFVVLAVLGFARSAPSAFGRDAALRGEPVMMLSTLSVLLTLPLHPAMTYQHFLLVLPLVSLYAGETLVGAAQWTATRVSSRRAVDAMLAVAALLLAVQPMSRLHAAFGRGNWGTLQGIRYVLRNTAPYEPTLDGFTGLGLFRPQAFYHHFHHAHAFALQTTEERERTTAALLEGEVSPKLVFDTHYLRDGTTDSFTRFVDEHYVPSGIEPIRLRPFDNGHRWWTDTEPRYLGWDPEQSPEMAHVYFDDAWRVPSNEYGAPVRRTRTRRSTLTVPIRRPRDFVVVFRAHADADEVPFAVELVVNGHGAGVVEAVPRWQDYEFYLPVQRLRPGFNQFELRFSAPDDDPTRRLELAVNYLQLVPADRESRTDEGP